jgi:hypothetical protein
MVIGAQAAHITTIAAPGGGRDALVLSRGELEQVTGLKRPSAICKWLDDHGWTYERPAKAGEMPVVAREYFHRRLVDPTAPTINDMRRAVRPNFDFMRGPAAARA